MSGKTGNRRDEGALSDVTVHVRHKQRKDADLSDVKVELVRHKQRRAQPSDVCADVAVRKPRREGELCKVRHKSQEELSDVRVNGVRKPRRECEEKVDLSRHKQRRNTHSAAPATAYDGASKGISKISGKSNEFVYVNRAYVGSLNSVNDVRPHQLPVTGVYREQYWACSKWSLAKKALAITVGVVLGAGIGLAIILVLTGKDAEDVIGGIFLASSPD